MQANYYYESYVVEHMVEHDLLVWHDSRIYL